MLSLLGPGTATKTSLALLNGIPMSHIDPSGVINGVKVYDKARSYLQFIWMSCFTACLLLTIGFDQLRWHNF